MGYHAGLSVQHIGERLMCFRDVRICDGSVVGWCRSGSVRLIGDTGIGGAQVCGEYYRSVAVKLIGDCGGVDIGFIVGFQLIGDC